MRYPLVLALAIAGCAASGTPDEVSGPVNAPARSAGDVSVAAAADRPADQIAALRAEGPAALQRLLARYDALDDGAERRALAATIDKVAAQRYATASRMFWYTDLEEAKGAAAAADKPILSLRMLGRLDEDLSCANSRIFRVVLYANRELSRFLRERFILHWSSERAVPRVVIDYGDGRVLERTITGNSVHYVLDADGRPVDALPGVYAPAVFRAELDKSLAMVEALAGQTGPARSAALAELHRVRLVERIEQWRGVGAIEVPLYGTGLRLPGEAALAQMTTVTKSGMEMPTLRVVDLGTEVGGLKDDPAAWAQIGLRLLPGAMEPAVEGAVVDPRGPQRLIVTGTGYVGGLQQKVPVETAPSPQSIPAVLDDGSRALIQQLAPRDWSPRSDGTRPVDPQVAGGDRLKALVDRFARDVVADTAKNEFAIRQAIRGLFVNHRANDLDELNRQIYTAVFRTPAADAWLGLAPDGFLALPADGVATN